MAFCRVYSVYAHTRAEELVFDTPARFKTNCLKFFRIPLVAILKGLLDGISFDACCNSSERDWKLAPRLLDGGVAFVTAYSRFPPYVKAAMFYPIERWFEEVYIPRIRGKQAYPHLSTNADALSLSMHAERFLTFIPRTSEHSHGCVSFGCK